MRPRFYHLFAIPSVLLILGGILQWERSTFDGSFGARILPVERDDNPARLEGIRATFGYAHPVAYRVFFELLSNTGGTSTRTEGFLITDSGMLKVHDRAPVPIREIKTLELKVSHKDTITVVVERLDSVPRPLTMDSRDLVLAKKDSSTRVYEEDLSLKNLIANTDTKRVLNVLIHGAGVVDLNGLWNSTTRMQLLTFNGRLCAFTLTDSMRQQRPLNDVRRIAVDVKLIASLQGDQWQGLDSIEQGYLLFHNKKVLLLDSRLDKSKGTILLNGAPGSPSLPWYEGGTSVYDKAEKKNWIIIAEAFTSRVEIRGVLDDRGDLRPAPILGRFLPVDYPEGCVVQLGRIFFIGREGQCYHCSVDDFLLWMKDSVKTPNWDHVDFTTVIDHASEMSADSSGGLWLGSTSCIRYMSPTLFGWWYAGFLLPTKEFCTQHFGANVHVWLFIIAAGGFGLLGVFAYKRKKDADARHDKAETELERLRAENAEQERWTAVEKAKRLDVERDNERLRADNAEHANALTAERARLAEQEKDNERLRANEAEERAKRIAEESHRALEEMARERIPLRELAPLLNTYLTITEPEKDETSAFDKLLSQYEIFPSTDEKTMAVYKEAQKFAPKSMAILITGESGVGKEGLASLIHGLSERNARPMIIANSAGLDKELAESLLFGHEKGAFTGAIQQRIGLFEQANYGTLFFDEIADLDIVVQTKILRAVENRCITRVGGSKEIPLDVRLIAASSKNMKKLVEDGVFRLDLYYRLNSVQLQLPPLRERGARDILMLAQHFLETQAKRTFSNNLDVKFGSDAVWAIAKHSWPGNARELYHAIEHALVRAQTGSSGKIVIRIGDLPQEVFGTTYQTPAESRPPVIPENQRDLAYLNSWIVSNFSMPETQGLLQKDSRNIWRGILRILLVEWEECKLDWEAVRLAHRLLSSHDFQWLVDRFRYQRNETHGYRFYFLCFILHNCDIKAIQKYLPKKKGQKDKENKKEIDKIPLQISGFINHRSKGRELDAGFCGDVNDWLQGIKPGLPILNLEQLKAWSEGRFDPPAS
jgi:DNA-binding NtrC family response regulator